MNMASEILKSLHTLQGQKCDWNGAYCLVIGIGFLFCQNNLHYFVRHTKYGALTNIIASSDHATLFLKFSNLLFSLRECIVAETFFNSMILKTPAAIDTSYSDRYAENIVHSKAKYNSTFSGAPLKFSALRKKVF